MIKILFAVFLFLHGIAHLVGFVVPWRIMRVEEMPYKTTLLAGKIDVGDWGIKATGLIWFILATGFFLLGLNVFFKWYEGEVIPYILSLLSLVMCVLGWPDAKIGIAANLFIVSFLIWNHYHPLPI